WSGQALLLLGLVWVTLRFYRRQAPATRYQIWLLGLAAVAVLPLWAALARWVPVSRPAGGVIRTLMEIIGTVAALSQSAPIHAAGGSSATSFVDGSARIWTLGFGAWAAGFLYALLRLNRSYARLRRICRQARPTSLAELGCDHRETGSRRAGAAPLG